MQRVLQYTYNLLNGYTVVLTLWLWLVGFQMTRYFPLPLHCSTRTEITCHTTTTYHWTWFRYLNSLLERNWLQTELFESFDLGFMYRILMTASEEKVKCSPLLWFIIYLTLCSSFIGRWMFLFPYEPAGIILSKTC